MNTLFPIDPIFPPGFTYIENFISKAEEDDLLKAIQQTELHTFNFQGYEAKRKVASFGYDWNFSNRTLTKGRDIPSVFEPLIEKTSLFLHLQRSNIAELLVTEYPEDSVINWHRDAPPFDIIAGVSLRSDCLFRFRPYDKSKQTRSSIISIPVKARSLYIIKGEARSDWEHSIKPVATVRYSITLRTLKTGEGGY